MTNTDWYERYRFVQPLGQCGNAVLYLAKDKTEDAFVVMKQYILPNPNPEQAERQLEMFHDEVRLCTILHGKGMIRYFRSVEAEGKLFLAMDPQSLCDYVCTHLKLERVERAIQEAS